MDEKDKEQEVPKTPDETKIEEPQTEKPSTEDSQKDGMSEADRTKSYWRETPFDQMQKERPTSFAGMDAKKPDDSSSSQKAHKEKKKTNPDDYWRPRNDGGNNGGNGNGGNNGYRPQSNPDGDRPFSSRKNRIGLLVFAILIIIFSFTLFNQGATVSTVSYSNFKLLVQNNRVSTANIKNSTNIEFTTSDGATYTTRIPYYDEELLSFLDKYNVEVRGSDADVSILSLVIQLVPWIIFVVFMVMLFKQSAGNGQLMSFGKSHAKQYSDKEIKVKFKDVAGQKEAKYELQEVVEFLKNPKKFEAIGAKIPKGVLLVGPPGTGKTLLAKAVAGEAGVSFFHTSGSDFVEMFVGMGAARVRDLFDQGRKHAPCILFIDEIDAVGRSRGSGLGGGHDEREQTLNQILVEMDGFGSSEGVIVMAATNRPDILDPALLRPGRFDRQITMNVPDVKGREEILKVHSRNKPFEGDVDLSVIAKTTVGFTGAELANLLNEAALLAARKGKHLIGMTDLEEAMIKVIVGPAKKSRVISEAEKRLTAYHETGHAITTWVRQPDEPVHQISIIPSGRAGGYTLSFPKEDKSYMSRKTMENELVTLLGGRVAEALIIGDVSTGASNDIQRASNLARQMVTKYGMSDKLGPILYGSESSSDEVFLGRDFNQTKNYSEETASLIDSEVKDLITKAYNDAYHILEENMDRLHFVAAYLMKNEIMEEEQFVRAMTEKDVTIEQLEEMVAEKRRKSREENEAHAKHIAELEKQREEERKRAESHSQHEKNPFAAPEKDDNSHNNNDMNE